MQHRGGILIMISYEIGIGFAIGRLISVFYEMGIRLTGDERRVHFSFGSIGESRSTNLPAEFSNLLEFDYRRPDAASQKRFAAYLSEHEITTLFALDMSVETPCLNAAREAGVRTVLSYWGAPMSSLNSGLKLLLKRLEVAYLRRSKPDYFIFESVAMRDFAVSGRGISASRVAVVHTGVDAERFRPMADAAERVYERFDIPRERRIVVYMGHLHRRKGVHVLLKAAEHLVAAGRGDIQFLFLGDREGESELFRDCFSAAESRITFGGYQADIPILLSGCYLGCIPSTGWDSFPMSSIEMQACGLPVVVSDWQGVPETVSDGETGVVVPVGDPVRLAAALSALVDEPARREQMSQAARRRVEQAFTREHQIRNLVACIGERTAGR